FFCAASLYLLDRAIAENLAGAMLLSLVSLYMALLTHYSSLIFALVLGLYALLRLRSTRVRGTIYAIWGLGQVAGVGLVIFLLQYHGVSKRRMASNSADRSLRNSLLLQVTD